MHNCYAKLPHNQSCRDSCIKREVKITRSTELDNHVQPAFVCLSVSLLAMPPAYFRGFNLIAVKEGTTGENEEDHVGEFKVKQHQLLRLIEMNVNMESPNVSCIPQSLCSRPGPSAEFSVDRDHPFMSFLSMLGPSPDWNVGLSAENLCTPDCSWVQHSVQDLIPWDAGTDSGTTYESPNLPTTPQERIRPLTSLDHPDSPFYDSEGGPITPVARVVIERLARKGEHCNTRPDDVDDVVSGEDEDEEDQTFRTCVYEPWSQWSACSSRTCDPGKQMRQRRLRAQLDFSHPCLHTQDMQTCQGHCPAQDNSVCTLSDWLPWSACSEMCGPGVRRRERYVKHYPDDGSMCKLETEETESCTVNKDCSPDTCRVSEWLSWSECSETCGVGVRRRVRAVTQMDSGTGNCLMALVQIEKCMMPNCPEFPCMLSIWTEWTSCSVTCAIGMRTRRRTFKQPAEADVCTEPLTEAEKCMLPECPIDCQLSEWQKWSQCSRTCGRGRELWVRHVLRAPHFGGTICPTLRESRRCRIPRCPRRGKDGRRRERTERGPWGPCSAACGGGQQQRVRRPRPHQIPNCSGTSETRTCNDNPCDEA
uniref:Spondin 1a n=1 Tax=Eptatretus burgeri TaxID=7764 RepID=A0A8C4Q8H1_EPTBU